MIDTKTAKNDKTDAAKSIISNLISKYPKSIWNRKENVTFKVSTGVLALDIATGGGIDAGTCLRVVGPPNQGKTSELLEIVRNLFKVRKKARGIYVDAEGRLSKNLKKRAGLNFTKNEEEWDNHTVFILESNTYDIVCDAIIKIILANDDLPLKDQEQFAFIIDSLDCLILEGDKDKSLTDSYKIAGPQVVTKKLMQKISLPLHKAGHLGLFTSQMTAQPRIDNNSSDYRLDSGSGGNSIRHAVDNIWEFMPRYPKSDNILENPALNYDPVKNKIIGHKINLVIKKSDEENNNAKISYSILHKRWEGNSIWAEREVGDQMVIWEFVTRSGSWLKFNESKLKQLRLIEPEFPEQVQGINGLYELLEKYPKVCDKLYDDFVLVMKGNAEQEILMD